MKVRLLGRPRIEDEAGQPCPPPRGQKSWAVAAWVALAERPLTRRELAAELFPEADDPLGALRWYLADLRRGLADAELLRGDPVSLAGSSLWIDVWALQDGTLPAADIGGELLAGAEPRGCPAFGIWLMMARARAAALDPLDEDAQELFLRTLVAAGHPARAAVHLASCQAVFAREGLTPSVALRAAARGPAPVPAAGLRAGGDAGAAAGWIADARKRCDRLPDRYVWVSGFVGLGQLEIAARCQPGLVPGLAQRLYRDSVAADLPEFTAWALVYQAEAGETASAPLARALAARISNPELRARAAALAGPGG